MGRQANKQELGDWNIIREGDTEFVGYDELTCETQVLRYRRVEQKGKALYQVVLSKTPFYAEMGGQVGDSGTLGTARIIDTKRENNLSVHLCAELPADIEGILVATVDVSRRQAIACNHTATHIVHYALRQVLGEHVEQKGSYVSPESLRFDFSHFQKVTAEELRQVEILANEMIRQDMPLEESRNTPIAKAKEMGAMALFGEKYGDEVRVIKYGPSAELCGGCHVGSTGKIGAVRIVVETSVAAGIRRIEAVTAAKADELYYKQVDMLNNLRALFNNAPDLTGAIRKAIDENAGLKKQIETFMAEKIARYCDELLSQAVNHNGIHLIRLEGQADHNVLRQVPAILKTKFPEGNYALVGATQQEGKPMITVILSQSLVDAGKNAGQIIKSAAKHIQGGGGGQAWMATAGGRNVDGLAAAMEEMLAALV
jgi:alanyl-tRNA synthetase